MKMHSMALAIVRGWKKLILAGVLMPGVAICEAGETDSKGGDAGAVPPPLRPVATAVANAMSFLKALDGDYVPGKPSGELASYFSNAFMGTDGVRSTRDIVYPARLHSYFIRAFLRCHTYTGDREWLLRAKDLGDWNIAHSTPADAVYPNLAYPTFEKGNPGGHTDKNNIQPDKSAFLGSAYLMLYEVTGEKRYLEAARKVAETLVSRQREDGSWPFRVDPQTGVVAQDRGGAPVDFVEFFEQLQRHDKKPAYAKAHDKALAYMLARNVGQGQWGTYHEDVGNRKDTHLSAEPTTLTADYLFRHADTHPEYLEMGRRILKQMEDRLVHTEGHGAAPAPAVAEQDGFEHIMSGHTARYGAALADLYLLTGDEAIKRRALSVLNAVTHMQTGEGVFVTFYYNAKKPAGSTKKKPVGDLETDRVWFSQHLFSVYYLLGCMAAFPELAPDGESHILGSSVELRDVSYRPGSVHYVAPLAAQVGVKLAFVPKVVTLGDAPLSKLEKRPMANETGWGFDPATNVLTLCHDAGRVGIMKQEE